MNNHTNTSVLLRQACELAFFCPHTEKALAVGCIITDAAGQVLSTGYSRELSPRFGCDLNADHWHAEACALWKLNNAPPEGAIMYASVEPCFVRRDTNGETPCAQQILKTAIKTIYIAVGEPDHFLKQDGLNQLRAHGLTVQVSNDPALRALVAKANPHVRF